MILADTSVWIDHFRRGNARLRALLQEDQVSTHPFVIGELACGTLRHSEEILSLLAALPEARVAEHNEVMALVDERHLYGSGIGWVDAHLLASALLSHFGLWTLDRPLMRVVARLGIPAG